MKYLKQLTIILAIIFLGELLKDIIPLPVPASIYGLVLMLAALETKLIPVHSVREISSFLIEIMPLMFIPAAVGLMNMGGMLQRILLPLTVITVVSTIAVMAVSGKATQFIIRLEKRNQK